MWVFRSKPLCILTPKNSTKNEVRIDIEVHPCNRTSTSLVMAPWSKKSKGSVYATPVPGKEPLRTETRNSGFSSVADFEKKDLVNTDVASTQGSIFLTNLIGIQETHSDPPIRIPSHVLDPQRHHDGNPLLDSRKVLPHSQPFNRGKCAPMGNSRHRLANLYASCDLNRYFLHESHHAHLVLLRCRRCEQGQYRYQRDRIYLSLCSFRGVGCGGGIVSDGEGWKRSLGIQL